MQLPEETINPDRSQIFDQLVKLHQLTQNRDQDTKIQIATQREEIVKKVHAQKDSPDETTMTDTFFIIYFIDHFLYPAKEELDNLNKKVSDMSYRELPEVKQFYFSHEAMLHETWDFFNNHPTDTKLYKAIPTTHPLANKILNIEADLEIKKYQDQFDTPNNPTIVIQSITDPESGLNNIWMSQNGMHYPSLN